MNYKLPKQEIFRAYDIRGIVDVTLTPDTVYTIGLAIGTTARLANETTILIGRDGRLSGPTLLHALAAGLMATGCDVIDIGAVPTPVLYFAAYNTANSHSGVILTGSHNPPNYNGLKIIINGETLASEAIQDLYKLIRERKFRQGHGHLSKQDYIPAYIDYITQQVKLKKPLKIVIDCGNGIPGKVAPTLFKKLGCDVTELYCEVDGHFPNHHPDPSQPENLIELIASVKANHADVGLAFDGDGDRLGMVTDKGEIIWPDRQMMLFAAAILEKNPQAEIIYDVKCTRHLADVIRKHNGNPVMWKSGHSLVKAKLREDKALLAGEMSGHIFFNDRWFGFDDGLYAGVRLLEILAQHDESASKLFQALPDSINTPELKLPLPETEKFLFMDQFMRQAKFGNATISTIDGLRVDFADGFGLIRPSNTTPCLVLRFEADSEKAMQRIQEQFRVQLLELGPDLILPF